MGSIVRHRGFTLVGLSALVAAFAVAPPTGRAETAPPDPRAASYLPVGPLRLADTREADCGCSTVNPTTIRVDVTGRGGVPDDAVAVAVTVTALPTPSEGFVTAYPGGTTRPDTSTLNTRTDRVVANSTIIPVADDGTIDVFSRVPGDVLIDISGVFIASASATAGRFVPAQPQRLIDTRTTTPLQPGGDITIALPDGVAADATALVINVTSLDEARPGYVQARPAGTPTRTGSFLNNDGSGMPVAASVVAPASAGGVTLYSHGGGNLIVDLVGWFTGASAADSTDGLFIPVTPHRIRDSRTSPPRIYAGGTIEVSAPADAAALVTNLTVTQADHAGFVTAYPAGTKRPTTSSLNPLWHNHTLANLAITRASERGVAYFSKFGVDAIVDLTGYFVGTPVAATSPPAPNTAQIPRVLVVGDSALAAIDLYRESYAAFAGIDVHVDADNCRRLVHRSCLSPNTGRIPATAYEAIEAAPGPFDVVYIDVGHNDWHDDDFFWQFGVIVDAARRQGATTILWATYTENVHSAKARSAYIENNVKLRWLTSLPQYRDVILADWNAYASQHPDWFWDGTHMYRSGAWATTDYINRWVNAIFHQPCSGIMPCPVP